MKFFWGIAALMAVFPFVMSQTGGGKKMVCYYGSWAVYRPGNGKFDIEHIDPFLCTHLVYSFAGLASNNTIQPLDPYNDLYDNWGKGAYIRLTNLKQKNPNLKTLIAIGGWNEGSTKYSQMAADPAKRSVFVDSVVKFLIKYNFDGFDFDWEYPANRGGVPQDKVNFVQLLRELKTAFAPYNFILSAAVSPGKDTIDTAYDIAAVSSLLDQIHLMCYDYHGAWEPYTGLNAPLYANPTYDKGANMFLNVNWTINYWISNGASPSKIVLGMGLYGRGFQLASPTVNGFYANAPQPITAGPYTREAGTWGYNEICEKFKNDPGWVVVRDPIYKTPYAYKASQWIGYDDQESLMAKAQYAVSMNLAGAMVWSIETDDFRALCQSEPFILIKTIVNSMNGGVQYTTSSAVVTPTTTPPTPTPSTTTPPTPITPSTTTPRTTTPSTTTPRTTTPSVAYPSCTCEPTNTNPPTSQMPVTTQSTTTTTLAPIITTPGGAPPPNIICKKEGLNADPEDCAYFYNCVNSGQGGWTVYKQQCASGTVFSTQMNTCAFQQQVPECRNYPTTRPPTTA